MLLRGEFIGNLYGRIRLLSRKSPSLLCRRVSEYKTIDRGTARARGYEFLIFKIDD